MKVLESKLLQLIDSLDHDSVLYKDLSRTAREVRPDLFQGEATMMETTAEEKALNDRDDRVRALLLNSIRECEHEARELDELAQMCRDKAKLIRDSVAKERWYDLKGIVTNDDIESLCEISPKDLLILDRMSDVNE